MTSAEMKFVSRTAKYKIHMERLQNQSKFGQFDNVINTGLTSAEMKFVSRTAKCTWQDYKTSEDVLPQLKISPVVNKIQNYRNKWTQHVRRMDGDRRTDCHN